MQIEINTYNAKACCNEKEIHNLYELLDAEIEKTKHHTQFKKESEEKMKLKEKKWEHRVKELDEL